MPLDEETRRRNAAWVKRCDWVGVYFPDQANEYADEMSRVAEGEKRETERSPHEIKREMKLLTDIEGFVHSTRVLVVLAIFVLPLLWQPSFTKSDTALAGWAATGWIVLCWFLAVIVGCMRFWKNYLNVLRQVRLQRFWEWRSATLRFPVKGTIPSELFEGSEPPEEAGEFQSKPPYLRD